MLDLAPSTWFTQCDTACNVQSVKLRWSKNAAGGTTAHGRPGFAGVSAAISFVFFFRGWQMHAVTAGPRQGIPARWRPRV
eukprot:3470420-Pyramimonas_sp.AAC.1